MIIPNKPPTRRDLLKAGAVGITALSLPASLLAERPQKANDDSLKKAQEVHKWLSTMRIEEPDGQVRYNLAHSIDYPETSLYSGTAGVLYFLRALNDAAPSPRIEKDREGVVRHLAGSVQDLSDDSPAGLYSGSAGLLDLLLRENLNRASFKVNKPGRPLARPVLEHYGSVWSKLPADERFGPENDLFSGLAGLCVAWPGESTSKSLWPSATSTNLKVSSTIGKLAADELIRRADKSGTGWKWAALEDMTLNLSNYSHGTIAASYALARAFELWPGRPEYLKAALKGVEYLGSIGDWSNANCRVFAGHPIDSLVIYTGRSHGTIGIARLFAKLHQIQPKNGWMKEAGRCARAVMNSSCDKHSESGLKSKNWDCCGNAGIAMFFMDMYRETKKQVYLEYAKSHIAAIDAKATVDAKGRRWSWTDGETLDQGHLAQTGLMQGAAGIGLMYLSMHALSSGAEWTHRLPDDPWFKGVGEV
ncbi:MAG: hypothetical protein KF784_00530 [Fimbriimonadaceae bacterium]|nr:hypothetical protein [Fimbriimonadaceae bacterium]